MCRNINSVIALMLTLALLGLPLPSLAQETGDRTFIVKKKDGQEIKGKFITQDPQKVVLSVQVSNTETRIVEIAWDEIETCFVEDKSKGLSGALWGGGAAAALLGVAAALQKASETAPPEPIPAPDKKAITVPVIAGAIIIGSAIGYFIAKKHHKTKTIKPPSSTDKSPKKTGDPDLKN